MKSGDKSCMMEMSEQPKTGGSPRDHFHPGKLTSVRELNRNQVFRSFSNSLFINNLFDGE